MDKLESSGRRPVLVLSPFSYNRKVGLAIMCPITDQIKGYPFEVVIPDGIEVTGAVLSDQVKCLDWKARKSELMGTLSSDVIKQVLKKLNTLIQI